MAVKNLKWTIVKKERIVFVSVLIAASSLLMAERLTSLEINSNIMLFFLIFTVVGSLSLIISQYLFGRLTKKYVALLLVTVFSVCFGVAVLTWPDNWKTQAILYRDSQDQRQTIEYRMRSKFGYGFEKQLILKKRILPYIAKVSAADTSALSESKKWIRVDEIVNEMGFPGEYVIHR